MEQTPYEQVRQQNINLHHKILRDLGIADALQEQNADDVLLMRLKDEAKDDLRKRRRLNAPPRRSSMRVKGLNPDGSKHEVKKEERFSPGDSVQFDVIEGDISFVDALKTTLGGDPKRYWTQYPICDDASSLSWLAFSPVDEPPKMQENYSLVQSNVRKLVPAKTTCLFVISGVAVVADKLGNLGFWKYDSQLTSALFRPHTKSIYSMCYDNGLITASLDGNIRRMDFEKQIFESIYTGDDMLTDIASRNAGEILTSTTRGEVMCIDIREKARRVWKSAMHERSVRSMHVIGNHLLTSGKEGTVKLWDIRRRKLPLASFHPSDRQCFASVNPSGGRIVVTSKDDTLYLLDSELNVSHQIHHNNQTGRWVTPFIAEFGDDDTIVIGNMNRSIDVYTLRDGEIEADSLSPDEFTAVPSRNIVLDGSILSANSNGYVHVLNGCE